PLVVWLWAVGVLAFFSLTPSRLEHYSIPALPAAALLAARAWQRASEGQLAARAWAYLAAVGFCLVAAGAAGVVGGADVLARAYWIVQVPGLLLLATPAAVAVAAAGVLLGVAALRRRPGWIVATL